MYEIQSMNATASAIWEILLDILAPLPYHNFQHNYVTFVTFEGRKSPTCTAASGAGEGNTFGDARTEVLWKRISFEVKQNGCRVS